MTVGLEMITIHEPWLERPSYELRIFELEGNPRPDIRTFPYELRHVMANIEPPKDCMSCVVQDSYVGFVPYSNCCPNETYSNLEEQLTNMK